MRQFNSTVMEMFVCGTRNCLAHVSLIDVLIMHTTYVFSDHCGYKLYRTTLLFSNLEQSVWFVVIGKYVFTATCNIYVAIVTV